jgi:ABC-type uncharacterized transport system substrate-binding protein
MTFAEGDPLSRRRIDALRNGLASLGWSEGHNVRFDYRYAGGDPDRLRLMAKELVALHPEVMITSSTAAADVLLRETRTIPVVFTAVVDPVASGFAASLARPGGNATGFTPVEYAISGKWLELLKEIAPAVAEVAVIHHPDNPAWPGYRRVMETVAPMTGIRLNASAVRNVAEIDQAIGGAARAPNAGLIVTPDVLTNSQRARIAASAADHRLPAVYPLSWFAESGGLVAYGPDMIEE